MHNQLSPLKQWAQSSPSSFALDHQDQQYSWAELADLVDEVASSLCEQGLVQGDVFTCISKNNLDLLLAYLACMEIGAICALAMPQTQAELETKLKSLYPSCIEPKVWVSKSDSLLSSLSTFDVGRSNSYHYCSGYQPDNIASIVFTSGSTGNPKAVAHTNAQHIASASGLLEVFSFKQDDCWLLSLPMYHVSGLAIVYRWLYVGATLKLGSGVLIEDIRQVTHASLVATQLQRLLESGSPLDLTHVLLGGSHVPLFLSQKAAQQGVETWLGYGMTEAASTVTAKRIDNRDSAGKTLPKRRIRLKGQRIYIGGETLACGYYRCGVVEPITRDGWFDSKDLGEWVEGELKIIGRADNLFISGGENIHCEEIEAVLNRLPYIVQSVVIPVEDSEFGHRPVAVIQGQYSLDVVNIEQELSKALTRFKWPVAYYEMPESLYQSGIKVSRKAVKDWLLSQLEQ
ncbi:MULTISPECIES: o-succinylbenzoate--CoA ligase [Vibrio]|uniref:o-succinylbenzoate--CoA ligase n=1 Tax=Vibrio TaxID=662 RepID=UPI00207641C7|nr:MULTISPECIES: o-succinylbenzoate--CoA ligase [Vibrio]USD31557.1 o-succinylbenzoate--CoA ligase [Vibrio sp. SCSIO 43186]USD44601.1 o-succinylbenzoate--CoA ligase [Vibrio sp. SCSIO 43145]USD68680.1 o-succinylbenzoate--CoA ligase [Vibrio sp. SCSIO 43139]USD96370.1 o-succinylbenzoate--CoA ligase [Vibrio coralliilyticus]